MLGVELILIVKMTVMQIAHRLVYATLMLAAVPMTHAQILNMNKLLVTTKMLLEMSWTTIVTGVLIALTVIVHKLVNALLSIRVLGNGQLTVL